MGFDESALRMMAGMIRTHGTQLYRKLHVEGLVLFGLRAVAASRIKPLIRFPSVPISSLQNIHAFNPRGKQASWSIPQSQAPKIEARSQLPNPNHEPKTLNPKRMIPEHLQKRRFQLLFIFLLVFHHPKSPHCALKPKS